MANPDFLDKMGDSMARVYQATHDKLLINLASHFKPVIEGKYEGVGASFKYQAAKLAEMGQVNAESIRIILEMAEGEGDAVRRTLEAAIIDSIEEYEPELAAAAREGILNGGVSPPPVAPIMRESFRQYYRQSMDHLNLVNTNMLESTQSAYRQAVSEVAANLRTQELLRINGQIERAQEILNTATGEVVTGVESANKAQREAVNKLVENGITGFIDHSGARWRPETYVAMDMRTTYHNVSRAAYWERTEEYDLDLYLVSQHPGARPLCYPWQNKVISRYDWARKVDDGNGREVQVYAQSDTTYGEPAGLFGINCGHYPRPFIPGATKVPEPMQDEEKNAETYAQSQQQRALERKLREARIQVEVEKAREDKPALKEAKQKVREASDRLDAFCEETGRRRRPEREYAPVNATWPDPAKFKPEDFPTATRDALREYFTQGGAQNVQS